MAKKPKVPSTPALRLLRKEGIEHRVHTYGYVARGGTRASSESLGVDEHVVIKTLVFEDERKRPLVVLMHGDRSVSAKALARVVGVKSCVSCDPAVAQRHSGYQVGGTSPFGLRKALPIWVERSILELPRIWINGGARGVLVEVSPQVLVDVLGATPVDAARP